MDNLDVQDDGRQQPVRHDPEQQHLPISYPPPRARIHCPTHIRPKVLVIILLLLIRTDRSLFFRCFRLQNGQLALIDVIQIFRFDRQVGRDFVLVGGT